MVEQLEGELRHRVYRFLLRMRFVIAPLPLLFGVVVLVFDPSWWRRILIVTALGTALVLSSLEDHRARQARELRLEPRLVVLAAIQAAVVLATGGVMSPVVMAMLMLSFLASALLLRRVARGLVAAAVVWLWIVAGIELWGGLGSLLPVPFRSGADTTPAPLFVVALLLVESMIFVVVHQVGMQVRDSFAELLGRVAAARDDALRTHAERLDELTRLAGEIAHELKNPLASIKGLTALLARQCPQEQAAHLAVLRGEADRMQATLDEFLNLSRPLVPLTTRETDLAALLAEVCALHEGQLAPRRVQVEVVMASDADPRACIDPRKVQQILVNLLQNAIEASPEQSVVRAVLEATPDRVRVAFEDAGPGLAAELEGRAFAPGVTTKPTGSGFGLTVARGLARQHGGEVTLEPRAGGGCVASLELPRRALAAAAAGLRSAPAATSGGVPATPDATPDAVPAGEIAP